VANAIWCSQLVKSFGSTRALDGLDLAVAPGEVHGFLGPNGSGKTVTMRILLGLMRHDAGEVRLLDADPWSASVELHRRLAYVPGDTNLWPTLTGGEVIDLLASLRGGLDPVRRADLIERFALDPRKKARTYSKGNRQKVALVAALAGTAELLILDEPTSGLDPLMEAVFQECILEASRDGRTVLLSSHILAEVEALCDRVTIIREGRTVQSGTLDELRLLTLTHIEATVTGSPAELATLPGVRNFSQDGRDMGEGWHVEIDVDRDYLDEVFRHIAALGVQALTSQPPSLEELFLRHYDDRSNEDDGPTDATR
jgi:ABC-2 type transport system ATP-binding protein